MRNFLDLEKISHQNKFEYNIDIADNVNYNTQIIPMCIQTHVENALMHGINPKNTKGNIFITIQNDENCMIIKVEDNGIGRKE